MTASTVPKGAREVAKDITKTIIGEKNFGSEFGSGSAFGYFLRLFGSRDLIRSEIGAAARGGSVEIGLIRFGGVGAVTCPVTWSSALVAACCGGICISRRNSSDVGIVGFGGIGAVM